MYIQLTFLLHCVLPDLVVVKGSQMDELDETIEVLEAVLNRCACDCPPVVCQ